MQEIGWHGPGNICAASIVIKMDTIKKKFFSFILYFLVSHDTQCG